MFVSGHAVTKPTETAAVLALVGATQGEWYRTAALIEEVGSALRVLQRDWPAFAAVDPDTAGALVGRVSVDDIERSQDLVDTLAAREIGVITVLDPAYPLNLRQVYNRPPMLFVRGSLAPTDDRSVAIVGTRDATPAGLQQAGHLSAELAAQGVTVISGLAQGIDTAAHEAALGAGRTIAVTGTGINTVYPASNRTLAENIARSGAVVSQFWPDAPPTRFTFPMRNVVMSGMALGTIVIEASSTSGAKMQARLALEHGKRLFLTESLVALQPWAQRYAGRPGTTVVRSADDVIGVLDTLAEPVKQLSFG